MSRHRSWLVLVAVITAVAIYLAGWAYYAWSHTEAKRYVELSPGATATLPGAAVRLLGLRRAAELKSAGGTSGDPAPVGAMWVVASMELVLTSREDDLFCSPALVSDGGASWPDSTSASHSVPGTEVCRDEATPLDTPVRFDATFQVPDGYLDDIRGVALVDNLSADPDQLLLPPPD